MPIIGTFANSSARGFGGLRTYQKVYPIGSTGPGGGIVFYDAGSTLSWGRYLEAATSSTSPSWSDSTTAFSGVTNVEVTGLSKGIGQGRTNTSAFYTQSSTANRAVSKTWTFTGGGFDSTVDSSTGWFLPSTDEMSLLYNERNTVGGFTNQGYWTSNNSSATQCFVINFGNGNENIEGKSSSLYSRAIRAF